MIKTEEINAALERTKNMQVRQLILAKDFLPVPGRTVALVLKDGRIRKGRLFVGQTLMKWMSTPMGDSGGENSIPFDDVLSWLG